MNKTEKTLNILDRIEEVRKRIRTLESEMEKVKKIKDADHITMSITVGDSYTNAEYFDLYLRNDVIQNIDDVFEKIYAKTHEDNIEELGALIETLKNS